LIEYLKLIAEALLLTAAIEIVIAWLFGLRSKTDLLTILVINILTNPLLNYLILVNRYFDLIQLTQVLVWVLEVCVVLVEWRLLVYTFRLGTRKMLILSLVMNGFSYLAGLFLF
jgi:hypothetical protein